MRPEWKIKTIGEVCEIYNGGTPSTSIPEYWDGGIQWITPKDMGKSKEMYVSRCERTISQEGVEHSSTKVLPERSVIVSSRAPIGYVAINDVPMATNQGCKGFVLGKELYPEFLYYFLLASTELLNKLGTGATFKEVSGKKLAGIEIPVPSIQEQQRIVDILDQEFVKIDALKANAEKSLQAAKDLFQATLKKALEPKDGWECLPLGSLCECITKGTTPTSIGFSFTEQGVNFVKAETFTEDGIILADKIAHISEECNEALSRSKLKENDILFSIAGVLGRVAIVKKSVLPANTNQALAIIRLKEPEELLVKYLSRYFKSDIVLQQIEKDKKGSAQYNLSLAQIKMIPVSLPPKNVIQSIVAYLDDLNEKCCTLQENYQKTLSLCEDLKQSLLRKAFNGEL